MSSSRRRKSYEKKNQQVQNRNIFAGIVLLLAAAFAIWLIIKIVPDNTPKIRLSTNFVDYKGTQKQIPFAEASCQRVMGSLGATVKNVTAEEITELDSKNTQLGIPAEINKDDVLIVYFNGHLIPGKGSKTKYLVSTDAEGDDSQAGFEDLIAGMKSAECKLKILLLDAGRFTKSPVFPGREFNDFQSMLEASLKRNDFGLDQNFWIIVSHSKNEFSRVSSILEKSLFAEAVAQTFKHFREENDSDIFVPDLFKEIRNRTASWSENLENQATQTPLLMRPVTGVVEPNDLPQLTDDEKQNSQWRVAYNDNKSQDDENKEEDDEEVAPAEFPGAGKGQSLFAEYRYDAKPKETVALLERYLEFGERVRAPDSTEKGDITSFKNKQQTNSVQAKTETDRKKSETWRKNVGDFRQAVLGITILNRLRNELKYWGDDELDANLKDFTSRLPQLGAIADPELNSVLDLPQDYSRFVDAYERFLRDHEVLWEDANSRVKRTIAKEKKTTPTQAEMMGRFHERYLPLVETLFAALPAATDEAVDSGKKSAGSAPPINFTLDLNSKDSRSRLKLEDARKFYDQAASLFANNDPQGSDAVRRLRLAAQGSENLERFPGLPATIKWQPLVPKIEMSLAGNMSEAQVNPLEPDPVEIQINAQAIDVAKLKIGLVGESNPSRLRFGFGESDISGKEATVVFDEDIARKSIKVLFKNDNFDQDDMAVQFLITAVSDDGSVVQEFPLNVTLTRNPDLVLQVSRKLDKAISEASLFKWGRRDFPDDVKPLMVRSLANIATEFDISLKNQSPKIRNLNFQLYNIRNGACKVKGKGDNQIRPDVIDGFGELSESLWKTSAGKPLPPQYQLLAEAASVTLGRDEVAVLKFLPIKKKEGESPPPPEDGYYTVAHSLLLIGSDVESGEKKWFQWIGFEPEMAADSSARSGEEELKPLDDILNKFEDQSKVAIRQQLNSSWKKDVPVARLEVVSPKFGLLSSSPELSLERIFDGNNAELNPGPAKRGETRILMMELFGVPGYRLLRQANDNINEVDGSDLVGLRIQTGEGCKVHPPTWSLLNYGDVDSDSDKQMVFLRTDSAKPNATLDFEFLLPTIQGDVIQSEPSEFTITWNGSFTRLFPNNREHAVQFAEQGLQFRTTVSTHAIEGESSRNISDGSVLEVSRKNAGGAEDDVIGAWEFHTESLQRDPTLTLSKSAIDLGNQTDVTVTVDVSYIRPRIDLSSATLLVDNMPMKDFFKDESNLVKTEFNLGIRLGEKINQAKDYTIRIEAKDFFDRPCSAEKTLKVRKKKKEKQMAVKVQPREIKVTLQLPEIENFETIDSLTIGGKRIPPSTPNSVGTHAQRKHSMRQVIVHNLQEGEHNFVVKVIAYKSIARNDRKPLTFQATAKVDKDNTVVELK